MENGDPINNKKKGGRVVVATKHNNESAKVYPEECDNIYGIDHSLLVIPLRFHGCAL